MVLDIVKTATGPCSQEELEELNAYVDDETITAIAKRLGLHDPNEGVIWQPGVLQKQIDDMADAAGQLADNLNRINKNLAMRNKRKKSGLGIFAFLGMLGDAGKSKQSSEFRVGDHVRVKYRGQEGTVIDTNGDLIMVSLEDGSHVDSYTASQLEKAW